MTQLPQNLRDIQNSKNQTKQLIVSDIQKAITQSGYQAVEVNDQKPWGAYFRLDSNMIESFLADFFEGLSLEDARLGHANAELSPKILLVTPGQRLSWQYHNRRAERWVFLTEGAFNKSMDDNEGNVHLAEPGDVVQFAQGERHRLVGVDNRYTIVAEIWQHTNPEATSDEDDIVRLNDDYGREENAWEKLKQK